MLLLTTKLYEWSNGKSAANCFVIDHHIKSYAHLRYQQWMKKPFPTFFMKNLVSFNISLLIVPTSKMQLQLFKNRFIICS